MFLGYFVGHEEKRDRFVFGARKQAAALPYDSLNNLITTLPLILIVKVINQIVIIGTNITSTPILGPDYTVPV